MTTATHAACATLAKLDRRASQDQTERYHVAVRRLYRAALALRAAARAFDRPDLDPADYPEDGPLAMVDYYPIQEAWRDAAGILWSVENFIVIYSSNLNEQVLRDDQ